MIQTFDYTILSFLHQLAVATGGALTPVFRAISFLVDGDKGYPLIILGLILTIIPKTRKLGWAVLVGMLVSWLFTSQLVKPLVARLRPYQSGSVDYEAWWAYAGSVAEKEFSFPSGHATVSTAFFSALYFTSRKKVALWGFLVAFLVCVSRNYLMVHYPTDVLGGFLVGLAGGYLASVLITKIYEKRKVPSV